MTAPIGHVHNGNPVDESYWNNIADLLNAHDTALVGANKLLRRGRRTTGSSTTTTEVGVLRVDSIPIISGHVYAILTSPLAIISTVANDTPRANIRVDATGASATTASTQLDLMQIPVTSTTNSPLIPLTALYVSATTGLLSVLLSVSRAAGTGSVSIGAGTINPVDLLILDFGVDPGNTGTAI